MIERHHHREGVTSSAVYSECGSYRYSLTRKWGQGDRLLYVMLNPSVADERQNDPTVERCERRARAMGFDAFRVANIFAWRATQPELLKQAADPVGPENDAVLLDAGSWADRVICAWGVHGNHLGRGKQVEQMLRAHCASLWNLGLTKDGAPRHPLYVAYARIPMSWS